MARPIKETPVLRGKDAERFVRENEVVKYATQQEIAKIKESFNKLNAIAQF